MVPEQMVCLQPHWVLLSRTLVVLRATKQSAIVCLHAQVMATDGPRGTADGLPAGAHAQMSVNAVGTGGRKQSGCQC
jgi:hypothetical protein